MEAKRVCNSVLLDIYQVLGQNEYRGYGNNIIDSTASTYEWSLFRFVHRAEP